MMISSILLLTFTEPANTVSVMLSACAKGITLCIELLAIYSLWLGILQIMEDAQITKFLAKGLSKPIDFCFGSVNPVAKNNITLNIASNILGLGSAATPFGIKAMNSLDEGAEKASKAMIMLVVINSTGIQFLPTTVIGMRAAANSVSPSNILLPSIIVTVIPTIIGVFLVKLFYRNKAKK